MKDVNIKMSRDWLQPSNIHRYTYNVVGNSNLRPKVKEISKHAVVILKIGEKKTETKPG